MKTILAAALCLATMLAPGMASAAGQGDDAALIPLQYAMVVNADGKATTLTASQTLPDAIDQWIRKRVGEYTFEPATVNGKPQPATTTLYLTLGPVSAAEGKTGYRITTLSTGPKLVKGKLEGRPTGAGAGYFIITYDQTGRVTRAELGAMQPSVGTGSFRKWALALARSLRLEPETVAGSGISGQARVPIVYCAGGNKCPALAPPLPEAGSDLGGELVAKSVLKVKLSPAGS